MIIVCVVQMIVGYLFSITIYFLWEIKDEITEHQQWGKFTPRQWPTVVNKGS